MHNKLKHKDLNAYVENFTKNEMRSSNILIHKFKIKQAIITIKSPLIHRMIIYYGLLLFVMVFILFKIEPSETVLLIAIGISYCIYKLWLFFEAITIVKIDTENKLIVISPRSILHRAIPVYSIRLKFNEVDKIFLETAYHIRIDEQRYRIYIRSDGKDILLTDFTNENTAKTFVTFLNNIIVI